MEEQDRAYAESLHIDREKVSSAISNKRAITGFNVIYIFFYRPQSENRRKRRRYVPHPSTNYCSKTTIHVHARTTRTINKSAVIIIMLEQLIFAPCTVVSDVFYQFSQASKPLLSVVEK